MCLSTVYANEMASENAIMQNVMSIEIEDGQIVLTDLMERTKRIDGVLKKANLVDGYVIVSLGE